MAVSMSESRGRLIHSLVLPGVLLTLGGIGGVVIAFAFRSEARQAAEISAPELEVSGTTLEHDFGILAPRQRVAHQFTVENKSAARWTIARFETTCQCTISEATAKHIEPGKSERITVLYVAPEKEGNVLQRVRIHFQERTAPLIDLQIRAYIRQLLSITPNEFSFPRVGSGQHLVEAIEIRNYLKNDLQGVEVKSSEPWLTVEAVAPVANPTDQPYPPRQTWRVGVRCDTEGLGSGFHRATLRVSAVGQKLDRAIPVDIVIVPPMEVIPGQLNAIRLSRNFLWRSGVME